MIKIRRDDVHGEETLKSSEPREIQRSREARNGRNGYQLRKMWIGFASLSVSLTLPLVYQSVGADLPSGYETICIMSILAICGQAIVRDLRA